MSTLSSRPEVHILGIRGIPARHGGFESFAAELAPYLVTRGWSVTVYCQEAEGTGITEDEWRGVRLVHVPARFSGPAGTVSFDLRSISLPRSRESVVLTLGYNTGSFGLLHKLRGNVHITNMDGLEWKRPKWSRGAKAWLWLNEKLGAAFSDVLVADHPAIASYLRKTFPRSRIETIPYGAREVASAPTAPIESLGLRPDGYALVIARPEPENSILEIVQAFSRRPRGRALAVLGAYTPESNGYHARVVAAAGPEVKFLGPIYEPEVVDALRFHATAYVHGHTVGGTNPSLVEALGAGCAVIAHDNEFNRWVAGPGAAYFLPDTLDTLFGEVLGDDVRRARMSNASRQEFSSRFTWQRILEAYEALLLKAVGGASASKGERPPAEDATC